MRSMVEGFLDPERPLHDPLGGPPPRKSGRNLSGLPAAAHLRDQLGPETGSGQHVAGAGGGYPVADPPGGHPGGIERHQGPGPLARIPRRRRRCSAGSGVRPRRGRRPPARVRRTRSRSPRLSRSSKGATSSTSTRASAPRATSRAWTRCCAGSVGGLMQEQASAALSQATKEAAEGEASEASDFLLRLGIPPWRTRR